VHADGDFVTELSVRLLRQTARCSGEEFER
jgi:hypothetical protein